MRADRKKGASAKVPKASVMRRREHGLAYGLVLMGGCFSAALAHFAAGVLGEVRVGQGLAQYAHLSVVPALLVGLAGLCSYVFWVATRRRGYPERRLILIATARRALRYRTLPMWLGTIGSGGGILVVAEAAEQLVSLGRVLPGELLGGSAPLMGTILAAVALIASLAARAILFALCGCAAEVCRILSYQSNRPSGVPGGRVRFEVVGDARPRIEMQGLTRRGPPRPQTV